jgi:hypothetical protein
MTKAWKAKRLQVMERDKWTCQVCKKNVATDVHHLTYDHIFNEPLSDLMAICRNCHESEHEIEPDESEYYDMFREPPDTYLFQIWDTVNIAPHGIGYVNAITKGRPTRIRIQFDDNRPEVWTRLDNPLLTLNDDFWKSKESLVQLWIIRARLESIESGALEGVAWLK